MDLTLPSEGTRKGENGRKEEEPGREEQGIEGHAPLIGVDVLLRGQLLFAAGNLTGAGEKRRRCNQPTLGFTGSFP